MGRLVSGPAAPPLAAARRIASCRRQAEPVEAADRPVPSSTAFAAQLPGPSLATSASSRLSSSSDHGLLGSGLSLASKLLTPAAVGFDCNVDDGGGVGICDVADADAESDSTDGGRAGREVDDDGGDIDDCGSCNSERTLTRERVGNSS